MSESPYVIPGLRGRIELIEKRVGDVSQLLEDVIDVGAKHQLDVEERFRAESQIVSIRIEQLGEQLREVFLQDIDMLKRQVLQLKLRVADVEKGE